MIQIGELFVIHEVHQQGVSIAEIARRIGMDQDGFRGVLGVVEGHKEDTRPAGRVFSSIRRSAAEVAWRVPA